MGMDTHPNKSPLMPFCKNNNTTYASDSLFFSPPFSPSWSYVPLQQAPIWTTATGRVFGAAAAAAKGGWKLWAEEAIITTIVTRCTTPRIARRIRRVGGMRRRRHGNSTMGGWRGGSGLLGIKCIALKVRSKRLSETVSVGSGVSALKSSMVIDSDAAFHFYVPICCCCWFWLVVWPAANDVCENIFTFPNWIILCDNLILYWINFY